jgi:hypothetical protein
VQVSAAADLVRYLVVARLVVEVVPTEPCLLPTKERDSVESLTLLE